MPSGSTACSPQPRSVHARPECPGRFCAREVRQRPAQGPGRSAPITRVAVPRRAAAARLRRCPPSSSAGVSSSRSSRPPALAACRTGRAPRPPSRCWHSVRWARGWRSCSTSGSSGRGTGRPLDGHLRPGVVDDHRGRVAGRTGGLEHGCRGVVVVAGVVITRLPDRA